MKHLILACLVGLLGVAVIFGTSMAADMGVYNIIMQAGEDFRLPLAMNTCADNPPPADPTKCKTLVPTKLDGYSYKAQFRQAPAPAGAVYATYSAVFVNLSAGRVDLRLSKAQTAANSGKSGVWDIRETNPSGLSSYPAGGPAVVKPTATR